MAAILISSAGKVNENVEPYPIVDAHFRSPFKHLAMFLLMLSPSPLPFGFKFLLFWSVVLKKGSKSLDYSSSEIPMPSSITSMVMCNSPSFIISLKITKI